MHNSPHTVFSSPEKETVQWTGLRNGMQTTGCKRVFEKESKERGRRGLRFQTVWELSPISKKQEVERNVTETSKDVKERKESF